MKLRELFEAKKLPNENSLGQPIAHTEEALKNFWNWFNGSKVVDSQGRPLVVYHGTNKKFKKINLKKGAQSIFWFTSDKSAVESGNVGAAGHGVIMELYVNIKNPANWKQYDQLMLDELKSRGFDGALLPDSDGSMTGFILNSHAQVKAVSGNKGTYSGNSIVDETLYEELENGEDRIKIPGGLIRVISPAPHSPRDASVVEFIVDENKRNQGIGSKLVHMAVNKYPDLGAQVSSIASMKAFYNNRFRNPKIPDGSFDDHIEAFNENWGSLFMASTDKEGNRY